MKILMMIMICLALPAYAQLSESPMLQQIQKDLKVIRQTGAARWAKKIYEEKQKQEARAKLSHEKSKFALSAR